MIYGVPQLGKNKVTKRVTIIHLESTNFAEEMFLTRLHNSLECGDLRKLVLSRKGFKDVEINFVPRESDDR